MLLQAVVPLGNKERKRMKKFVNYSLEDKAEHYVKLFMSDNTPPRLRAFAAKRLGQIVDKHEKKR